MDFESLQECIEIEKISVSSEENNLKLRDEVKKQLAETNSEIAAIKCGSQKGEDIEGTQDPTIAREITEKYGTEVDLQEHYNALNERRKKLEGNLNTLAELRERYKNFKKSTCFSNIRELLRQNPNVKIGQIEKGAGVQLGYMSRLEKEGNISEPSVEFIVTAAKLFKVSLDTLISVNLTDLTPTEQYIVNFFDKLKADTLADKLYWNRETADSLNCIESDMNGYIDHPLFDLETFYEESECEYPEQVTRIVFDSHSFGPRTCICGDCFNLRMKNGIVLYLMSIEKSVHRTNDSGAYAKEVWTYSPQVGCEFLVSSKEETPIAPLVETLYSIVNERMKHPKLNKAVMYAIDSFMKDDLTDDDNTIDLIPL